MAPNGVRPGAAEARWQKIADELRAELALQETEIRHLREQLDEAQSKRNRLQKAVTALVADEVKPKPKRKSPTLVTAAKLDMALNVMREAGKPLSVRQIADTMGVAPETARKAVYALRDQQQVRLAGSAQLGGTVASSLYALMPEAVLDAA